MTGEPMESLRVVGAIFGLLGICCIWYLHYRRKRLRTLDFVLGNALALALLSVAIFPDAFNSVLNAFSFERGGGGRLLGLLIFSNLALYVLVYVALARSDRVEQHLDRLVRELAKKEFREKHRLSDTSVTVVIPAYNEANNIGTVLSEIPESVHGLSVRTLVVVDGATDATAEAVQRFNGASISYTINRGGGSALKAGYEIALESGADYIVTLDADGQHLPGEIPRLLEPLLDDNADLVNGSRVLGHYEKDDNLRAAGVTLFNALVSLLTMTRITDCSNAFRAIRASCLQDLELRQTQFHTSELLIEALKKGWRVVEVPITIRKRQGGQSKKGPSWRYAMGFTRAILSTWLR